MSEITNDLSGLLLIDKPTGWTSHDVVAKVRNVLRTEIRNQQLENSSPKQIPNSKIPITKVKVGHTGTLDPLATGLMIVVVGSYCKRAAEFSKLDKTYEVTMKLGETSATGDEEGVKTKVQSKKFKEEEIKQALDRFQGEIMQTPPIYSAIKVDGKRAYKLAREGKEVKMEPRQITIYNIDLINYTYPFIKFTTKVSSGTYIRSLVEDIGRKLATGAYMTQLHRTEVGQFKIRGALEIKDTTIDKIAKI